MNTSSCECPKCLRLCICGQAYTSMNDEQFSSFILKIIEGRRDILKKEQSEDATEEHEESMASMIMEGGE